VHDLLQRRDKYFAKIQEHYFVDPMRIERGWMHLMMDTNGRSYVDMVNNVAAVGHGICILHVLFLLLLLLLLLTPPPPPP